MTKDVSAGRPRFQWRRALGQVGVLVALFHLSPGVEARMSMFGQNVEPASHIRPPAVAGRFYPADRSRLLKSIELFLAEARAVSVPRPVALVVPHAGYIFSGQIAADAFRQAASYDFRCVAILGTNHTVPGFNRVSVYPGTGFETPLGVAAIDTRLASKLTDNSALFTFDEVVHRREHSVEVQVPFVQTLFPEAKILPLVVGTTDPEFCRRAGDALAENLGGEDVLIVASSDLSHYPSYAEAGRVDRETLKALRGLDSRKIQDGLLRPIDSRVGGLSTYACGAGPIMVAAAAARKLGAVDARMVSYANSGDTALGSRDQVVGYGAVAFVKKPQPDEPPDASATLREPLDSPVLENEQKSALLAFARRSITQYLISQTAPLARDFGVLGEYCQGVFVTLTKDGNLRGCVGNLQSDIPLAQAVGHCALGAAFGDSRFRPLEPFELEEVEIEIFILSPLKPIADSSDIRLGIDGVLLEKKGRSAVFLPSVPIDQGWNLEEMLEQLSVKAGLPPESWRSGANFKVFQTLSFSETALH